MTRRIAEPGEPGKSIKGVYDECADEYTATFVNEATVDADLPYLQALSTRTQDGGVVLDVGCGPGMHGPFFVSNGYAYVGCDLSRRMIEIAQGHCPSARFLLADARELPFEDSTVDSALALESLVHLSRADFLKALRELRRCLRSGAPILLGLQQGRGSKHLPYPLGPGRMVHVRLVNEDVLLRDLQAVGLELLWARQRKALPGEIDVPKLHALCLTPEEFRNSLDDGQVAPPNNH